MTGVRLSHLARYVNGFAFKPADLTGSATPVVRIRQLLDPEAEVDRTDLVLDPRFTINDGDLIFSWSGTLAVRVWNRGPALLNQHLFRVDPESGVERRWLRYALEHSLVDAKRFMHGSAMTHITRGVLDELKVEVPAEREQREIADFLDAETARIDALIDSRTRQAELVRERQAAARDRAITDAGTPMRLARALRSIQQGWSPECEARVPHPGEWGVLKAGATNHCVFREDESKALPPFLAPRAGLEVAPGNVLMSRANTRELAGSAAFVNQCRPRLMLSDKHYRVVPEPSKLHPRYLALILQSSQARSRIQAETVGSSASMQNISQDLVRDLRLPIPSLDAQARIVSICSQASSVTRAAAAAIDRSITLLRERRQALITAAVSGRVDVGGWDGREPCRAGLDRDLEWRTR